MPRDSAMTMVHLCSGSCSGPTAAALMMNVGRISCGCGCCGQCVIVAVAVVVIIVVVSRQRRFDWDTCVEKKITKIVKKELPVKLPFFCPNLLIELNGFFVCTRQIIIQTRHYDRVGETAGLAALVRLTLVGKLSPLSRHAKQ